jgi:hypothetical protein
VSEDGWKTSAASRAGGISFRQLDYWTTLGHLRPVNGLNPGSGRPREWDDGELRVAGVMWALRLAGLDLPTAAAAARKACAGRTVIELAPGVYLSVPAVAALRRTSLEE